MISSKKAAASEIKKAKKTIIDIGRKCWQKGWVAANSGNISFRISENEILCTPTGISKGMLTQENICMIDPDGNLLQKSRYQPSSEIKMHLRVMKERPDVRSVFHAHPPYATAHAVAGIPFSEYVIPEIVVFFGTVPIAPYGTPSTSEVPDRLAPLIKGHDVWLLENHGALTAGVDPYQAYFRMESLELYAQTMYLARGLGKVRVLDRKKVRALVNLRKKFGIVKN